MFKVGDIVRGKSSYNYRVTNEHSKCLVTEVRVTTMRVRVMEAEREGDIGREFGVEQSGFELVEKGEVKEEIW